jgi:mannose/fructose-specific phosphotransferase system component IIA
MTMAPNRVATLGRAAINRPRALQNMDIIKQRSNVVAGINRAVLLEYQRSNVVAGINRAVLLEYQRSNVVAGINRAVLLEYQS